jgi:hypothetical protein
VLEGEGEGEGESLRFWIEVDLESREGGWANAGSDFLVERARGDCDILDFGLHAFVVDTAVL